MPRKTGVAFGQTLQAQCSGPALPPVLQRTLVMLSQQALHCEDLFSKETDTRKVSLLRQCWDRGQDPFRMVGVSDCHAAARVLVQWLQSLPQPLLQAQMYPGLARIVALESPGQQQVALQRSLTQVDACTMQVLQALLSFLHRYTQDSGTSPKLQSRSGQLTCRAPCITTQHPLPAISTAQHPSPPLSPRSRPLSSPAASELSAEDPALGDLVDQLCACSIEGLLLSSDEQFQAQSMAATGVDASSVQYTSDESVDGGGDVDTVMQVSGIQENAYACGPSPEVEVMQEDLHLGSDPHPSCSDITITPSSPFYLRNAWHQQSTITA
ncbi:hypothetical protein WJX73_007246 [Symbiochloris irregularis]|uniref:Rho-GAP domain-containing protein n=1 Tax=Symbiochloris irregularis TaxID=706552 RepID=A0AAW1NYG5_9CHLO